MVDTSTVGGTGGTGDGVVGGDPVVATGVPVDSVMIIDEGVDNGEVGTTVDPDPVVADAVVVDTPTFTLVDAAVVVAIVASTSVVSETSSRIATAVSTSITATSLDPDPQAVRPATNTSQ